ncbi:hypothetical protein VMCG_09704 [Cytospora schulzeri]|uniref:Uncharacterized protein n=1 Tax=Cytospora schulzeri TaxID=448051 RepID=A0A423VK92_9PEZI|nr:hypothetical protein VMCG_09704 [Valsa malicola]
MDDERKSFLHPTADTAAPPSILEATSLEARPSGSTSRFQTRLACISRFMNDRMRFLNFSIANIISLRDRLGMTGLFKSISFDWTGKLKIIDAPPSDLTEALVAEFTSNHRLKSHELDSNRLKLKFHGQPWQGTPQNTVQVRVFLLKLLEIFERFGYSLYVSIDHFNSHLYADVMVMTRQKGWMPGMPIWHR